jgi:hypothetical protein
LNTPRPARRADLSPKGGSRPYLPLLPWLKAQWTPKGSTSSP